MVYITGDTHGNFNRVADFCYEKGLTQNDIIIILGDAGINYSGTEEDYYLKKMLSGLPTTLFCIHGNHENRPENIPTYQKKLFCGGLVHVEDEFPNILFAIDSQLYRLGGRECLVCGGAYSVDKFYRLARGWNWWDDEQPSQATKQKVENVLKNLDWKVDILLTHTCPEKYIPREMFLPQVDQSTVDSSTEKWLGEIEGRADYNLWYCGHYHTDKGIDKMRFLFNTFQELGSM